MAGCTCHPAFRIMRAWKVSLATLLLSGYAAAGTIETTVLSPGGKPVEDAAIVVEPLAGSVPKNNRGRVTIEQRDREFMPYVTIVQTGTAIDFPNHDPI